MFPSPSLPIHNQNVILENSETNLGDMDKNHQVELHTLNINATKDDIDKRKEVLLVIVYLAGYYCYAVY